MEVGLEKVVEQETLGREGVGSAEQPEWWKWKWRESLLPERC